MRVGGGRKAPPPAEGNAAGWGGRGRRVRDEPHDRARRGRAPCTPRRGDRRGCGRRIEGATKGAARQTPPPPCRGTGATPRASGARATEGKRQAPPPKGGGCRKGGAGSGPPSPAGGAPGGRTQRGQGEDKGHVACPTPQQEDKCRAKCQYRACDVPTPEEGQRGRPPPPRPHLPHPPRTEARATGRRRGGKRDDESVRRTPPPGTPRQGGEAEVPDDRAQGEHAPCKPPRGDRRGCNRRKGRVTTGATRQPPPPPQRRDRCRASCLRRASDVLAQKGGQRECPPPPRPLLLRPPAKRARTARRQREDMGGGRGKKKTKRTTKDTNTPEQGQSAGADGTWREPGGTARGAGQRPWG